MLGAIAGDIVGSRFEFDPIKTTDFDLLSENCVWTDDTVLTLAVADALVNGLDMAATLRRWTSEYPASYGHHFWDWSRDPSMGPYGSYGNGSSMRVSAAAWLARDLPECLAFATRSAEVTHNHPEGIRGARATAVAIYAARTGMTSASIRKMIFEFFGYDLSRPTAEFQADNVFEIKSWKSVPQAMICALEARSFEEALRLAVSFGGDADTQAAIAGSIAEPLYGIPEEIASSAAARLLPSMADMLATVQTAAAKVVQRQISPADLAVIPQWDPEENVRWEAKLKVKFGVSEDPPGYQAEMDKLAGLFGSQVAPRAPDGWIRRVMRRFA